MEQDFFVGYHNFAGKQRTLSRILGKLQGQDLPSLSSFTVYLQALHRRDVSACTLRTVFIGVHGFLVFLQKRGKISLSSLTGDDLEAFVESEQDRGLKPLSIRGRLHSVYAFLHYLLDRGMVPADVLARRIRIKLPTLLPRAMEAEDVKRLLGVLHKVRDAAMILVLLRTGMRIGELLRTRVSDVHLEERKIQLVVGEKNRTGRVVYLSADSCQALTMVEETGSKQALAFLRPRAGAFDLHGRPGHFSAAFAESRDCGEGLFVACAPAHLCYGAVECGDAPGVLTAASGTQQCGADQAICPIDG
jgi:integrase